MMTLSHLSTQTIANDGLVACIPNMKKSFVLLNRGQRLTHYDRFRLWDQDGNDPFARIFSDRATISGHDNPVFNNLTEVHGSVLAANVVW